MLLALALLAGAGIDPATSAERCGACHRAIHEAWKKSAHAQAMESRLFQDALEKAEADLGAGIRRTCLGCHAPLAALTSDMSLQKKVNWEGVTCDYCHTMRSVDWDGPNPRARLELGQVKTGSLKDTHPVSHGAEFSAVHTTSEVCAPCHEFRNPQGLQVMGTYSEWKASPQAKAGKQCQDCHMSRVAGDVVDPRVKASSGSKINLHQMPGSHSLEQLNSTIRANLSSAREDGKLKVTIQVANIAAGHYVPTGSPLRKILLELRANSYDGRQFREERVYGQSVVDAAGEPLSREHMVFAKGAKFASDTRLAPAEKRLETFYFDVPPGVQTQLNATLWYYFSPMATTEAQKRITFRTISRLAK